MSYLNTARERYGNAQGTVTTRRWPRLAPLFRGGHASCPRCQTAVQFTGAAPASRGEELVKKVAGDRQAVPLHWLEDRLADALYREELRQGAWMTDIGLWGDTVFRQEAARMLAGVRREFGRLARQDEGE